MAEPLLCARGLGRRFGRRWLFRVLDLDVTPGMALAVLGPNGTGKSTLLRVLAGLIEPSEGSVRRPSNGARSMGYAALDLALYPALTGREHLELGGRLRGVPDQADALLEAVGLSDASEQMVGEYSSGMRARIKLALAVQTEPSVLLLDEPSAALDRSGDELVGRLVGEQLARGAVVYATNDPKDMRHATHEIVLGG